MADDDRLTHETGEGRQRRQQALRSLAQASEPNASPAAAINSIVPSLPRQVVWRIAIITTLGMVLLSGLGYFAFFRSAPAKTIIPPLFTSSTDNRLACAKGMDISPDGASIAILGYQDNCPSTNLQSYAYHPGQVNLYSIATGHFIAALQLDNLIDKVLHPQIPSGVQPASRTADTEHAAIQYEQILWSSDGQKLAIAFSFPTYTSPTATTEAGETSGVLLTDIQGIHTRILSHTRSLSTIDTGVWNVADGTYVPIPTGTDQSQWRPAPPAIGYSWDATNTLAPQGPTLTSTTLPPTQTLGPIGNPIGGHSFTVWQTAQLQPIVDTTSSSLPAIVPGSMYFVADFPAWSPDGALLFLNMNIFDVLVTQKNDSSTLPTQPGSHISSDTPLLSMRDKGLSTALADTQFALTADGNPDVLTAAWRPDGRVLAVSITRSATSSGANQTPAKVRLYDCTTGKLLITLRGQQVSNTQQAGVLYLRWSSNSSHLVLLDGGTGQLSIWGSSQLPKG